MDNLTSPLLLPIALAQGVLVRLRTPRLPPATGLHGLAAAPDLDGAALQRDGSPLRLLAVGDSIIAGVGCTTQDEALTGRLAAAIAARCGRAVAWQATGANGATARTALQLLPRAPFDADLCLVSVGVNDVVHRTSPARFGAALSTLVATLLEHSPRAAVVFAGVPPLASFPSLPRWPLGQLLGEHATRLQSAAREVAARAPLQGRLHCFDLPGQLPAEMFSADGFHPGPRGCAIWADGLVGLAVAAVSRPST
jgi:lysophospholipase L1-like esterase